MRRALARNPDDRYPDVSQFVDDLREYLADAGLTDPRRAARLLRRSRRLRGGAAGAAVGGPDGVVEGAARRREDRPRARDLEPRAGVRPREPGGPRGAAPLSEGRHAAAGGAGCWRRPRLALGGWALPRSRPPSHDRRRPLGAGRDRPDPSPAPPTRPARWCRCPGATGRSPAELGAGLSPIARTDPPRSRAPAGGRGRRRDARPSRRPRIARAGRARERADPHLHAGTDAAERRRVPRRREAVRLRHRPQEHHRALDRQPRHRVPQPGGLLLRREGRGRPRSAAAARQHHRPQAEMEAGAPHHHHRSAESPTARIMVKDPSSRRRRARRPGSARTSTSPSSPNDEPSKEVEVGVDTGDSFTSERVTVRAGQQLSVPRQGQGLN